VRYNTTLLNSLFKTLNNTSYIYVEILKMLLDLENVLLHALQSFNRKSSRYAIGFCGAGESLKLRVCGKRCKEGRLTKK